MSARGPAADFALSVAGFRDAVGAWIEAQGMVAENAQCVRLGRPLVYGEAAFIEVLDRYELRMPPCQPVGRSA